MNMSEIVSTRENQTQLELAAIYAKTQEALLLIADKYQIIEKIGYCGGIATAIFVSIFITFLVVLDLVKLLSYIGIINPPKTVITIDDLKRKRKNTNMKSKKAQKNSK